MQSKISKLIRGLTEEEHAGDGVVEESMEEPGSKAVPPVLEVCPEGGEGV